MTGRKFAYDRLHRLRESKFMHETGTWTDTDEMRTSYGYDANGNLEWLTRNGYDSLGTSQLDTLRYSYNINTSNQVTQIDDVTGSPLNGLMDDAYGTSAFSYDGDGNMIQQNGEELIGGVPHDVFKSIQWNRMGKVECVEIITVDQTNPLNRDTTWIKHEYDPLGARMSKKVINHPTDPAQIVTTFYMTDGSGLVLGIYDRRNEHVAGTQYEAVYRMVEQPMYGDAKLGRRFNINGGYELARIPFDASVDVDPVLSFDIDDLAGIHGYEHWISPATKAVELLNMDTVCDCQIKQMDFPSGVFNSTQLRAEFMGHNQNNVAIGEDMNGNLLFYSATPKHYLGNADQCLVYDRNGDLMRNSSGLESGHTSKPMAMNLPGSPNLYLLFTLGTDNLPYAHTIDMSQDGFGNPGDKLGMVVNKNQPLDPGGTLDYGQHMAVIEDQATGSHLIYMTRYAPPASPGDSGTTDILAWELLPGAMSVPPPVLVHSFKSLDADGNGELQISPDGTRLAYYSRLLNVAGFAHQQVDIHVMQLTADRKGVSSEDLIAGSTAGTYGKSSMDFSADPQFSYYNQHGVYQEPLTGSEKNIWQADATGPQAHVNTTEWGELRKGKDDKIYIGSEGNETQVHHITQGGGGSISLGNSPIVVSGTDYLLEGHFPTQPYCIAGDVWL